MIDNVNWWPAVVFDWPAILLAIVLSVLGITKKSPAVLVASAVIAIPFLYLLGWESRDRVARVHDPSAFARSWRCRPLSPGGDSMVTLSACRGGSRLGGKSCHEAVGLKSTR